MPIAHLRSWGEGWGSLYSGDRGFLCGEFQCIMGSGHIAPPLNKMTDMTKNITISKREVNIRGQYQKHCKVSSSPSFWLAGEINHN